MQRTQCLSHSPLRKRLRHTWSVEDRRERGGGNIHIFVVLLLVVLCLHYACICEHEYMNTAPPPHSLNGSFEQLTESNYA